MEQVCSAPVKTNEQIIAYVCNAINSDTMKKIAFTLLVSSLVLLFMTSCPKDEEAIDDSTAFEPYTILPEGGTHTFNCGITLEVPEGAVDVATEIELRKLGSLKMQQILAPLGKEPEEILTGFEVKPEGISFSKDVIVRIQDVGLEAGDFVIVHELDMDNNKYTIPEISFTVDPAADRIDFSVRHFCGMTAEEWTELQRKKCEENPELCKCKAYLARQSDKDIICNSGGCQQTRSKLTIEWLACDLVETHYIYEYGEGCKPEIKLSAGSILVKPGEQTTLTAEVIMGCEGLEGQVVDFSLSDPGLGTLNPTTATTNADGKAQTTFTAGETRGMVTVTVNSTVNYTMYYQEAIGEGGEEINEDPTEVESVSAGVEIEIADYTWAGTFAASFSGCNSLVCLDNYSVAIDFTINELDEPQPLQGWTFDAGWMGEADVTQNCTGMTSEVEETWVDNMIITPEYTTTIFGSLNKETREIAFEMLSLLLMDHFDADLAWEGGVFIHIFATGFLETVEDGVGGYPQFNVILEGDEVTKSGDCMINLLGEPEYLWGPYSLTLVRHTN